MSELDAEPPVRGTRFPFLSSERRWRYRGHAGSGEGSCLVLVPPHRPTKAHSAEQGLAPARLTAQLARVCTVHLCGSVLGDGNFAAQVAKSMCSECLILPETCRVLSPRAGPQVVEPRPARLPSPQRLTLLPRGWRPALPGQGRPAAAGRCPALPRAHESPGIL